MSEYSLQITALITITITILSALGIGGFGLFKSNNFKYRFYGELKNWLKIETEINKGEG